MKTVVAQPGDGIGIECVEATCELLTKAGLPLRCTPGECHQSQGLAPEETKKAAREAEGVLFGAAGPSSKAVVAWLRW
jgi:isocitrate/isopropylmalate dehydrogenase